MQYLYLIECQNHYKIGVASDVQGRLAQLSTGNPFELNLLAVYGFTVAEPVERALHQKYTGVRVRGEWFRLSPVDLQEFRQICVMLGGAPVDFDAVPSEEEVEEAEEQQVYLGGLSWRLERRKTGGHNGYAVKTRGKDPQYLTYISASTLKNPEQPTVEEVERALQEAGVSL